MTLADLDNVKKRVIRILNANQNAWSNSVSGEVGAFPDDNEIVAGILEADEMVVTSGYFESINRSLKEPFMSWFILEDQAKLPFHYGEPGKVEVASLPTVKNFIDDNVTPGTDQINIVAHNLLTGAVIGLITTGVVPAGLSTAIDYFVIFVDANNIKLANSLNNALLNIPVDITAAAGGGTHSIIPWVTGIDSHNADSMTNAKAAGNYAGASSFDHLYAIENDIFDHPAAFGRIELAQFTRTAALQANQSEETLVIATAVRLLIKNASPAPFKEWTDESIRGIEELRMNGKYTKE